MDLLSLAIMLFVGAIVLALVDVFVPSGGMLLILACVAGVASILFGFRAGTTEGMSMLTAVVAAIPLLAYSLVKVWPRTPIGRRIILGAPQPEPAKSSAGNDAGMAQHMGKVVMTDAPLMPSGQVKIDHRYLNAAAESGFIDIGQRVKVIGVRTTTLIVRPTDEPLTASTETPRSGSQPDQEDSPVDNERLLDMPADQFGLDSLDDEWR